MRRTVHEVAIRTLQNRIPDLKIGRFGAEVRAALKRDPDDIPCIEEYASLTRHIRPDAYRIDETECAVYAYEIEDASKLLMHKMLWLGLLWLSLEGDGWDLHVYVLDRYGLQQREVPLGDFYFAALERNDYEKVAAEAAAM